MVQGEFLMRAKVQTYFCAIEFPGNRWQSQSIFSGKSYATSMATRNDDGYGNRRMQPGIGRQGRSKAASASAGH
jgi:hypothetical protein